MALTPGQMGDAIIRNLPEKTGRSLEEWMELIKKSRSDDKKEQINWLKEKHGLGSVQAAIIVGRVHRPAEWKPKTDEEFLSGQFKGDKEKMRPVYETLVKKIKSLRDDIEIAPRNTMISFICGKQFGKAVVSTRNRIDLGLKIPGILHVDRLVGHGSIIDEQITHRVELYTSKDIDDQVMDWVNFAYKRRKNE